MDTGTHLVMGLGLAGLAHVDPVVSGDPAVAAAVLAGTVLGQQAPDFDTVTKLRGNAAYIRNHRGISHSIPAVLLWTAGITLALHFLFGGLPLLHVGGWVFLAVALHVFSDMFNAYGTQALRPFSKKWVSWNIISIFDPVIFITHGIAICLWALGLAAPAVIFPILYAFIVLYYAGRTVQRAVLLKRIEKIGGSSAGGGKITLIPTVSPLKYHVIQNRGDDSFLLGELHGTKLRWTDKVRCNNHAAAERSKEHADIRTFLSFTSFACAEVRHHSWGYEVRWMDVRYRHRRNYPFVAVLLMDRSFEPLDSFIGWRSENRISKLAENPFSASLR